MSIHSPEVDAIFFPSYGGAFTEESIVDLFTIPPGDDSEIAEIIAHGVIRRQLRALPHHTDRMAERELLIENATAIERSALAGIHAGRLTAESFLDEEERVGHES